jgi:nitroreductase
MINSLPFMFKDFNGQTQIKSELIDKKNQRQIALEEGIHLYNSTRMTSYNRSLLTRNLHRIEKALVTPNRKHIAAEDFISETVVQIDFMCGSEIDENFKQYAFDVLDCYFNAFNLDGRSVLITNSKNEFLKLAGKKNTSSNKIPKPYGEIKFKLNELHNLTALEVYQKLCESRVSTRQFTNDEVDREKIEKIVAFSQYSPSSCNRQGYRFIDVRSKKLLKEIIALPHGTKIWGEHVPHLIVVVCDFAAIEFERDEYSMFVDASLSVTYLQLAMVAAGLGTCLINWPNEDFINREIRRLANLTITETPVVLMAYGVPTDEQMIPYSQKKMTSKILYEI